jgi:hypothetical protein
MLATLAIPWQDSKQIAFTVFDDPDQQPLTTSHWRRAGSFTACCEILASGPGREFGHWDPAGNQPVDAGRKRALRLSGSGISSSNIAGDETDSRHLEPGHGRQFRAGGLVLGDYTASL